MSDTLSGVKGLLVYVGAGLGALVLAAWLSTQFIGKAFSQTPTPSVAPALPNAASAKVIPGAIKDPKIANPLADIIEDYDYNPVGKRDPFAPFEAHGSSGGAAQGPLWPLQRFDLDQLKLVGIIWDVKSPKAMILDPTGKGYVVKVNERIGRNNGYIARIREGEIVVVESIVGIDGKQNYQTKLVRIVSE